MTLRELIDRTTEILDKGVNSHLLSNSEHKNLILAWGKLKSWVYPQLTVDDMQLVTRCKHCKYYKKYKKKDNPKAASFWACSKTKLKREPDFFCKDGEQK